jgi:Bacterial PH domain
MKYVERVLQPGETVQYLSTIHWIVYVPGFLFLIVGVIGLAFLAKSGGNLLALSLPLRLLLPGVGCIGGLLSFIHAWFKRWTTELAVTNRRIIYKRGLVRRHTIEMNMDKVECVDVDQSFWGAHSKLRNYCRARNRRWPRAPTENRLPDRVSQRSDGTLNGLERHYVDSAA